MATSNWLLRWAEESKNFSFIFLVPECISVQFLLHVASWFVLLQSMED